MRDNIPDIIKKRGQHPVTRILDDKEYIEQLFEKLIEEIDEFDEDRNAKELADIFDVLSALGHALNINGDQLKKARTKKAAVHGTFKKRLFLEKVED